MEGAMLRRMDTSAKLKVTGAISAPFVLKSVETQTYSISGLIIPEFRFPVHVVCAHGSGVGDWALPQGRPRSLKTRNASNATTFNSSRFTVPSQN